MILVALSLGPMPFADQKWELLTLLGLLAIGSGLTRPPVFGMISNLTAANEQGVTIGVAQGMGALARIVGPMFSAILFMKSAPLPYLICATVSFLTGLVAWQQLSHVREPAPVAVETAKPGR